MRLQDAGGTLRASGAGSGGFSMAPLSHQRMMHVLLAGTSSPLAYQRCISGHRATTASVSVSAVMMMHPCGVGNGSLVVTGPGGPTGRPGSPADASGSMFTGVTEGGPPANNNAACCWPSYGRAGTSPQSTARPGCGGGTRPEAAQRRCSPDAPVRGTSGGVRSGWRVTRCPPSRLASLARLRVISRG